MKILVKSLSFLSVAGILTFTACNSDSNTSTSSDTSTAAAGDTKMQDTGTSSNMSSNTDNNANPDQATIDYMVPKNASEMAWLMAGISMGTSKEVKDHAKAMLADHKKLGATVEALIASKKMSMPPVDTAGVVSLMQPKGKEWDKAWNDQMVKDHTELLERLNAAETSVKDADLKKIVTDTKPVVQKHLDMAKMMQGKM